MIRVVLPPHLRSLAGVSQVQGSLGRIGRGLTSVSFPP
jgi:hypothetical protein